MLVKLTLCILCFASMAYSYLHDQNEATRLRMLIPQLERQLIAIQEENMRLQYEIEQFESPAHLILLAKECEYRHLCHPYCDDILVIQSDQPTQTEMAGHFEKFSIEPRTILVGVAGE